MGMTPVPQASRSKGNEYWRPASARAAELLQLPLAEKTCLSCGIEYSPSARFCHVCGNQRDFRSSPRRELTFADCVDLAVLRSRLGLSVACMVCFVIAVACALSAAMVGVFYRTQTLVEWQAVQMWRLEWLLAAATALLAGILLKKRA